MENKNKEESSSVYEEAYSQCSYEKYQKERDSTLRSTNVDKENKYFKVEEPAQNFEAEEKPKNKLRSKKKKKAEIDEIPKKIERKEDDDYGVNGGFDDPYTPEEPKERVGDPMENENIKGGCCMNNNNNCIIY